MTESTIPKVSVIIPIYNTAAYLPEALDSICHQTLRELQIILINDGSTDNSQEIIEEYAAKDPRIEWYRQANAGQGHARNVGIGKAKGEYVYFMDSDDILQEDCLLSCYEICQRETLDYVTFDAESFDSLTGEKERNSYSRNELISPDVIWDSKKLLMHALSNFGFKSSVCLFLYRRALLVQYDIEYPEGIIHEDNAFVLQTMLCADRAKYLPAKYFLRRIRPYSTMTTRYSLRNIQGYVTTGQIARGWMKERPDWKPYITLFLHRTLNSVVWLGHQLTWSEKLKAIRLFLVNRLYPYVTLRNWMAFLFK